LVGKEALVGTILCATRGGEASYRTQDRVIALAKEETSEWVFAFAVDTQFLDNSAELRDASGVKVKTV
jgi:hypothetical protein